MRKVRRQISFIACAVLVMGCSRSLYRKQADRDVFRLVREKQEMLGLGDEAFRSLAGTPESRFFDEGDPDFPTRPKDDPLSRVLMRRVAGKRGSSAWDGPEASGSDERWREVIAALPRDSSGAVVLDLPLVVRLSRLNSREFQNEREDLYLSALDVSLERFDFSPQFAAGTTGLRAVGAKDSKGVRKETESVLTDGSVRWMSATGGELMARFANSFVYDFRTGATVDSLVNFSLVQPLMRLGGRARVMEGLTQAERSLLANVRQMDQYQRGFYVRMVAGRNGGDGPVRSAMGGGAGLGVISGTPSGRTGAPRADGFLGLLEEQQRIRNLEANVARLRESLDQISAAFDAGRISSRLQVDQARQALFNSQSSLLASRAAYRTRVDAFKLEMGLPPSLEVVLKDGLLERLSTSNPGAIDLDRRITGILRGLRSVEDAPTVAVIGERLRDFLKLEKAFRDLLESSRRDMASLKRVYPWRKAQLERLMKSPLIEELSLERGRLDAAALADRVEACAVRLRQSEEQVDGFTMKVESVLKGLGGMGVDEARAEAVELGGDVSALLLGLSLNQTSIRLETATLPRVDVDEVGAMGIAEECRLDWMNVRARQVDAWRRIAVRANDLQSVLDFGVDGSVGTVRDNALSFGMSTSTLRGRLRFDTPLNRFSERNRYREALIEYQRARRDTMLFGDRVSQSVRNTLRIIELSELNFEVRRAAVQIAISQVDLARLRLDEPPRPGAVPVFGATTARDLVSALSDLLDSQNDFLGLRIGYDVLRMALDFELGTMQMGEDGLWSDPGEMTVDRLRARVKRWREGMEERMASSGGPEFRFKGGIER
jgi:hypothetical protein